MASPPREPEKNAVWIALEDIRDPGNLGTIIRTADAVGASGVILVGQSCDPFSRECVRATMGSLFSVPLVRMDPKAFAALASKWPGDLIGTRMKAERDFRSTYRLPALIVMGSEGSGLSPEIASLCTAEVRIPMAGNAESLNVAIAAALMLYEVRRPALK
jgi:TrmH family RNA methyltransferase